MSFKLIPIYCPHCHGSEFNAQYMEQDGKREFQLHCKTCGVATPPKRPVLKISLQK